MLHSVVQGSQERAPAARAAHVDEPQYARHPQAAIMGNQALLRRMLRSGAAIPTGLTAPAGRRSCLPTANGYPLQRKCAACEEDEKLHRKEANSAPGFAPAAVHEVLNSPGQPLDPATRAFFERRFGADLNGVRIHDSAQAAASADAVGALGYTVGQHIAFARGQYQPGSDSGRRLLAHELAHTFQQRGASSYSGPLAVSPAAGPDERAADRLAAEALAAPGHLRAPRPPAGAPRPSAAPSVAKSSDRAMLQREVKVTCSVDPIKIAKALGGDKSAALDILSCCESGLSPLPAGCSKDVIDAVRKLLGKKPAEKNTCPIGFHPAHSATYQGQCCKDSASSESQNDCCPGDRINQLGTCCPVGQVPEGMKCVTPGPGPRQ
jgi:hypothetical protein